MRTLSGNASQSEPAQGGAPSAAVREGWLIDGHVHLHRSFDTAAFLTAAVGNAAGLADQLRLERAFPCLLFTEGSGEHRFDDLRVMGTRPDGWRFTPTNEPQTLIGRVAGENRLVIVAGRQIVTRERLEVLALGTRARFKDHQPIGETIQEVQTSGALAVIPWGFGKWWFARGALLRRLIESAAPGELFLGDNRARPHVFWKSRIFRLAAARGIAILPGSDPLPLRSAEKHVAGYGFWLPLEPDWETPMAQIASALRSRSVPVIPVGRRESLFGSLLTQARLRLHHRQRTPRTALAA